MRPERFSNSDADMNIGVAIGAANVLEKGVFIIMNGLVIPIENATRNQETGQFLNTKSRTKA
jgi:L-asparaginase